MTTFIDSVRPWHDLYTLLGTASATLIGLLFVAASVGSKYATKESYPALRVFISPSVAHFTCVFLACLAALAPTPSWTAGGALVGGVGLFGFAYSANVWRTMVKRGYSAGLDWEDWFYYAVAPPLIYAGIAGAGALAVWHLVGMCTVLAVALTLLLVVGIRNAWDITLWTAVRSDG